MYKIKTTKKFEKDALKCFKRNLDMSILQNLIELLEYNREIPEKYKVHILKGNFVGLHECHLKPDLINLDKRRN